MKTGAKAPIRHIRKIPRLKISNDLAGVLGDIAVRAATLRKNRPLDSESDAAIFLHAAAGLQVENAINHFLSQRAYELPLAELRKKTAPSSDLVASINSLLEQLSAEDVSPFEQMRALYCYRDPDSDGLDTDERKRESMWDRQLSPAALATSLRQWLELLGELYKTAGKGRQPITAQIDFVRELATWWRQEVKADITASLGSSRADYTTPQPKKSQRGLFAQFIQTAAEGIPGNEGLSWDRAIRQISEEKR